MELDDDIARVTETLRKLAGGHEPRRGQIEAVESLAIRQQDTVLVAATGYGKSAVLFALSALKPDKITVQIVRLVTLEESQRDDIAAKLPESTPVWIDADTHLKNKHIWREVEQGKYSHVLLSPEQALDPKFKVILKDLIFHTKIGLFAIDELHCVGEWRHFRENYTYLYTLRSLLPASVPWFGCTATLDRENQVYIFKHAGFNPNPKIIRTSIDRPEISIVVQPLLRGCIHDYRRLYFPLEGCTVGNVRDVDKTIIYLDNKSAGLRVRYLLLQYLRRKCGFSKSFSRKAVRRFDADVRPPDKEIIFKDFANVDTDCRIIVATVSLGMGMDIPDMKRVVQFGIPPGTSIADIWQRIRRAVRKQPVDGRVQGTAFLFIPYWVFDHLGTVEKQQKPGPRKMSHPKRRQQPFVSVRSRLQLMTLVDRDEDTASDTASQVSANTQRTVQSESQAQPVVDELTLEGSVKSQNSFEFEKQVKWTKQDISQREKLDPVFMAFMNASCFRRYALEYLQEDINDPELEYRRP